MFQQRNHSLNRKIKTSQPKFRRINQRQTEVDLDVKKSTHVNFPQFHKNNAFDTSKQNLLYEKHLIKIKSACKLDETTIVSKYLNSIRKNYDDMSKISKRQLDSMKLKKREIQVIKINNKIFANQRLQINKKIEQRILQTEEFNKRYQDIQMQKKTLEHIINRMKKDQIVYKQCSRIKEEEMKKRQKKCKQLDETLIVQEEKISKLMNQLQLVKKVYNSNTQLRVKKYQDFQMNIEDVVQKDKFIQQRKDRTFELRSIQLNDTNDEKNIHMRQIILSHKVADSLLQFKVNNLLKNYSDIQSSFNLIKTKTNVNQPKLLTSKFFSYENSAQNLLRIIRQSQLAINELNQTKQTLSNQYKQLVSLNLSSDKDRYSRHNEQDPKTQLIINQINKKTVLINQIYTLINKNLSQLNVQHSKDAKIQQKLKILSDFTVSSLKQQNFKKSQKKITATGVRLKKVVKQLTTDELNNNLKELQEMRQNNLTEQDFLNTQRRNIMKKGFSIKQVTVSNLGSKINF